jgi:hypothetical protein
MAYARVSVNALLSFLLVFSESLFWKELSKEMLCKLNAAFFLYAILLSVRLGLDLLFLMALS